MKRLLLLAILIPSLANAATERIVYVNTDGANGDGSVGTPYSTLYNALNAETKTLVASDRQLTIRLRGATDDTADIATPLTAFAGNTDATRYIRIVGDPGSSAGANQGKFDDARYRFVRSVDGCSIDLSAGASTSRLDYRIENIQLYNGSSGNYRRVLCPDYHPGEVYIIGNVIHTNLGGAPYGDNKAVVLTSTSSTTKINSAYLINNIIYDTYAAGVSWFSAGTNSKVIIYNNTFSNNGNGGTGDYDGAIYIWCQTGTSDIVSVKNNVMQNSTGSAFQQNYTCETYVTANNITEDATSPDVSYRSKAVTFLNEASDDFHLASGDTNAKDAGANLSADSYYAFTTDIDGQTRSAPWDIGADEYQSGGTSLLLLKHAMEN